MTSFFSSLLCFFPYSRLSSYLLRLFILFRSYCSLVRVFRKNSSMSSSFPIAILNGTFFFRSVKAMNNWKRSAIKQILLLILIFSDSATAQCVFGAKN